jgi:hypothetical protein
MNFPTQDESISEYDPEENIGKQKRSRVDFTVRNFIARSVLLI